MFFVFLGILLIVAGVICIFLKKSAERKLINLTATETYTVKVLKDLSSSVSSEIGKGSFRQMAEVKGIVECDTPLTTELSKEKCVYYKNEVEREYEEIYYEEDSKTHERERKVRQGSELISSNVRNVDFYVKDETGKIKVNPDNSEIDSIKIMDKYEPADSKAISFSGNTFSFGGISFNIGSLAMEGKRILGYRLREYMFPLNKNVYVLGEVSDAAGELVISKPSKKGSNFIISTKSEEELTGCVKSSIKNYNIVSIILLMLGCITTFAGILMSFLKR